MQASRYKDEKERKRMQLAKTLENHILGNDKTVKDEMMTDNADKIGRADKR